MEPIRRKPEDIEPYSLEPNAYYWIRTVRGSGNGWFPAKRVHAQWFIVGVAGPVASNIVLEVGVKIECPYKD